MNSVPVEGLGPVTLLGTPRWQTTGIFIDRTLDFAERKKKENKPFFVSLWFSETHDLHTPRPEDAALAVPAAANEVPGASLAAEADDKKKKTVHTFANFQRTLVGFDRDIGRLISSLKELGLEENTLLIFTADNGPQPLFDRSRTGGLRGQKWSLYEGGIREPFVVRWSGQVPAGKTNETAVLSAVDMLPTLCAMAGAALPEGAVLDGENLSAAFLGELVRRTHPLFWQYGDPGGPYLKPADPNDQSPSLAVREGDWKLLAGADGIGAGLYDLAADRSETRNLAAEHPDIVRRLSARLKEGQNSLP